MVHFPVSSVAPGLAGTISSFLPAEQWSFVKEDATYCTWKVGLSVNTVLLLPMVPMYMPMSMGKL